MTTCPSQWAQSTLIIPPWSPILFVRWQIPDTGRTSTWSIGFAGPSRSSVLKESTWILSRRWKAKKYASWGKKPSWQGRLLSWAISYGNILRFSKKVCIFSLGFRPGHPFKENIYFLFPSAFVSQVVFNSDLLTSLVKSFSSGHYWLIKAEIYLKMLTFVTTHGKYTKSINYIFSNGVISFFFLVKYMAIQERCQHSHCIIMAMTNTFYISICNHYTCSDFLTLHFT